MADLFPPSDTPRVFALPAGVDFPRQLVEGLRARLAPLPPEAVARVELFVNTRRMQRRVKALFATGGATLLPRIRLVTDLERDLAMADLPPPVPPLRRRLELAQLVQRLLDVQPHLAPRSSVYDLADSLAALLSEMQGEDVPLERLEALDLADHAQHWERSLAFIRIAARFLSPGPGEAPDAEARRRMVVERLESQWLETPPAHPIIVAGSTGSRGTTARLMRAVSGLPQGAVVLPGYDFDLPEPVWDSLDDGLTAQDHPQARFRSFLRSLDLPMSAVQHWDGTPPPCPERNRLVSLALRPAPVTDQWMEEGPTLSGLDRAVAGMTLIEAPSPRAEALSIALLLRDAAERNETAALITPDRSLTRQVTAALDRWGILPDDSAGRPLALSPPGRFLRHVAALFSQKLTADALLTLLKHPLTHTGAGRGPHLRWTREFELRLRRHGPVFPTPEDIGAFAARKSRGGEVEEGRAEWGEWLAGALTLAAEPGHDLPLTKHVARHRRLAELLAAGPVPGSGILWEDTAGDKALAAMEELAFEAPHGGQMNAADYRDMVSAILARGEVREAAEVDSRIMIWGTLEARVHGAELVILGGLNEGSWPKMPPPDPWLNRQMRHKTGLLLPERQIGLSAHDFEQAVTTPRVVLSRAIRSDEAETVPARWMNRLVNLMGGLKDNGGPEALAGMRRRGAYWLKLAEALETPARRMTPAPRPSPRPPVAARPLELPVTDIGRLIRDPYAVYARRILRLRPLDPLRPEPDAALRGSVLHEILARFSTVDPRVPEARARLMEIADTVLAEEVPWPVARRLWRARLDRAADWFLAREARRTGTPRLVEKPGGITLEPSGFRLTARPDRIDELPDGRIHIYDYKTGSPPTEKQQRAFDKQLLLEAAMAERGAFEDFGLADIAGATYIGLGATPKEEPLDLSPAVTAAAWEQLAQLIARYAAEETGYTSRRAMFSEGSAGAYDHLARFGEWEMTATPEPEDVGQDTAADRPPDGPEDMRPGHTGALGAATDAPRNGKDDR